MSGLLFSSVRGMFVAFCRVWLRLRVLHTERLPEGPFILAPNHRSYFDTPITAAITKRRMRYMGKAQFFRPAPFGWFCKALGAFPVNRDTIDREALRRCLDILANGEALVIFPEGTRKLGSAVEGLFEGAAYLALKSQLPVVPLGIGGTERALGKGMRWIRPRRCSVVVGEPIAPPTLQSAVANRTTIRAFTEQLNVALQAVFNEAERVIAE